MNCVCATLSLSVSLLFNVKVKSILNRTSYVDDMDRNLPIACL